MAQNYYNLLGGRNVIDTSPINRYFEFKNESTPGANDGTAIVAEMFQELYAFFINLAIRQSEYPSGATDVAYSTDATKQQFFLWMEQFIRPTGSIFFEYPGELLLLQQYPHCEFVNISIINPCGVWRVEGLQAGNRFGGVYKSEQEPANIPEHSHFILEYNTSTQGTGPYRFIGPDTSRYMPTPFVGDMTNSSKYYDILHAKNPTKLATQTNYRGLASEPVLFDNDDGATNVKYNDMGLSSSMGHSEPRMFNRTCRMYRKVSINMSRRRFP